MRLIVLLLLLAIALLAGGLVATPPDGYGSAAAGPVWQQHEPR